jgi:hypothetical protein
VVHDGLLTMERSTHTISVSDLDTSTTSPATLAWYTLEGDLGGTPREDERVVVTARPGGEELAISDGINPGNNPMNRTINTSAPPLEDVIGVDIDRFDITAALSLHDTSVDIRYSANSDKWWLALNVVEVGLASGCAACDLNVDGGIDSLDLAIWTPYLGSTSSDDPLVGDFNGDGRVGLRDLIHLRSHFGDLITHSPATIPEPRTAWIALPIAIGAFIRRNHSPRPQKERRLRWKGSTPFRQGEGN